MVAVPKTLQHQDYGCPYFIESLYLPIQTATAVRRMALVHIMVYWPACKAMVTER